MLAALVLELSRRVRRMLAAAFVTFVRQRPRERLLAVVVILAVIVDFAIPLLALGCMSWGHCPLLHP